jgi:hypothetical protein
LWCWGLNLGLCTSQVSTLSLSYTPSLTAFSLAAGKAMCVVCL